MDTNELDKITVSVLAAICRRHLGITRQDGRTRASLYDVFQRAPAEHQTAIINDVHNSIEAGITKYKRRAEGEDSRASKRRRTTSVPPTERLGHNSQEEVSLIGTGIPVVGPAPNTIVDNPERSEGVEEVQPVATVEVRMTAEGEQ